MTDLLLASASPRRAHLLRGAGLRIEVRPVDCDETPHAGEPALDYARRIARRKLDAALAAHGDALPLLAADTVVWREPDAEPLGKPRDLAHARAMLGSLLDAEHRVTTAWALARPGTDLGVHHETTRVWMRAIPTARLEGYLRTDEWRDKAGGYGIQGEAAAWVTRIAGSYTNVVGLPLAQVLAALEEGARP